MKFLALILLLLIAPNVFGAHDSLIVTDTSQLNNAAMNGGATDAVDHIGQGCGACRFDLIFSSSRWMVISIDTGYVRNNVTAASFDSIALDFTVIGLAAGDTLYIYPLFKPFNVDSTSYDDWDADGANPGQRKQWGTSGAGSTNDAGVYNTTDNGGDDRYATAQDSVDVPSTGSYRLVMSGTIAEAVHDVDITGFFISVGSSANFRFATKANTTAADRPFFSVYFQTAAAAVPLTRRRRT